MLKREREKAVQSLVLNGEKEAGTDKQSFANRNVS